MKVLIADDSKLIRDRLSGLISVFREVSIVDEVSNGEDALESLKKYEPDIAIIGIRMPGKNGLEVIKEYRQYNKSTRIIVLTYYAYDQYRNKAMEYGAEHFFNKSEDFEKVAGVIASMLREKQISDELLAKKI